MGWTLARDTLITIVEGTTPTTGARGLPSEFTHVPQHTEDTRGNSRTFRFKLDNLRGVGPLMPSAQTLRSVYAVTLEIDYGTDLEPEELDDAIQQDYLAIRARLLDDSLWDRPTSTIELLLPETTPNIMPATIERDDTGARLVMPFDLEFRG